MESGRDQRYIEVMTKMTPPPGTTTVRDPQSGQRVIVKGVGALKGRLIIEGVDLTKPIASQILLANEGKRPKSAIGRSAHKKS